MHEYSMAVGILNTVLDTAEANNAIEVTEMVIEIGKLAMLNPEQLKFMLGALCQDTIAENAKITIEDIDVDVMLEGEELTKNAKMIINTIDVEIKCHNCGFEGIGILDDSDHYMPMILCPECESHRVEVINGRDINVKNISVELEDDEEN